MTVQEKKSTKNKTLVTIGPLLSLAKRVEDFLIPPLCVACDKPLGCGANDSRWLCAGCLDSLSANHARRDACPRCSVNRGKRECGCEFAWDFPFERVFSIFDYDDTLSAIARHIKYHGKSRLALEMGLLGARFVPEDFWDGADIVIPVPLHKLRMRKRGYNQSEFFARGVLKGARKDTDGLIRTDLLKRVRNTGTQTKLDREGRLENLVGAFAMSPGGVDEIKGKRVVLVDDIWTTGATTEACTDVLMEAGCGEVRVLSMGRA